MQLKSGIEWQITSDMQNQWKLMKVAFAKHLPVELLHMPRNTTPFYFVKKLSLCGNLSGFFKCQWSNFNCHQEMDLWPKDVGLCLEYCVFFPTQSWYLNCKRVWHPSRQTPPGHSVEASRLQEGTVFSPPWYGPMGPHNHPGVNHKLHVAEFSAPTASPWQISAIITPLRNFGWVLNWFPYDLTIDDPWKLIQYCGINPLRLHVSSWCCYNML